MDLRRAMALSIDRTAFIDILSQGQGEIGGVLEPPPGGLWGMPPDQITTLPGYDPDVQKNRNQARQIMQKLGYGPDKPLGDVGADIFCREVQAVWDELFPFADKKALATAQRLGLGDDAGALAKLVSPRDFPRLLAALIRTGLSKDYESVLRSLFLREKVR